MVAVLVVGSLDYDDYNYCARDCKNFATTVEIHCIGGRRIEGGPTGADAANSKVPVDPSSTKTCQSCGKRRRTATLGGRGLLEVLAVVSSSPR